MSFVMSCFGCSEVVVVMSCLDVIVWMLCCVVGLCVFGLCMFECGVWRVGVGLCVSLDCVQCVRSILWD